VKEGLKRRCCGIDVHKTSVSVCVLPAEGQKGEVVKRRNFPTFTRDLKQLRNWLKKCGVTEIAMESTGQYWRPLWNVLEGEFEKLLLVNPQHHQRAGRPQDGSAGRAMDCGVPRGQAVEGQLGTTARDSRVARFDAPARAHARGFDAGAQPD
jgi:hypothetical protein